MKYIYAALVALSIFVSCTSGEDADADQVKIHLQAKIDSLHKKMIGNQPAGFNKALAVELLTSYHDYVSSYPQDSLAAEYLFRMSDLARGVGDYNKALSTLAEICANYKDFPRIPECLFLQGYYYQEFFKDTTNARLYFEELLKKYPDHAFADDAVLLMQRFGKSDEEIIKEFEEKAARENPSN